MKERVEQVMRMSSIGLGFFAFMLSAFVSEANSYKDVSGEVLTKRYGKGRSSRPKPNYEETIIGSVGAQGQVIGEGVTGRAFGDDKVRNEKGRVVGTIMPYDRELVFDGDKVIGSVNKEGKFFSLDGVESVRPKKNADSVSVSARTSSLESQGPALQGRSVGQQNDRHEVLRRLRGLPVEDTYQCRYGSRDVVCKTKRTISNEGKAGWRSQNEAAYMAAQQLFVDGQCFKDRDREAAYLILKKGDMFFYGYRSDFTDDVANSSAPVVIDRYKKELELFGYSVVGIVHNHPLSQPGKVTMFSEADIDSAQMAAAGHPAIDCYMLSCDDSSMGENDVMRLYRYVKAEDKAYVVKKDGSQYDAPIYIKEGASGGQSISGAKHDPSGEERKSFDNARTPKVGRIIDGHLVWGQLPDGTLIGQEGKPIGKYDNGLIWYDSSSNKEPNAEDQGAGESPQKGENTVVHGEKDGASQIGVKGWCRCGSQKGRIYSVGGGDAKGNQQGPYTYSLCGRCGKIERPEDADGSLWILDNEMERKRRLEKRKYSHQDFKEVERKLLAIPDGQIVIPGKCACTSPDPTKTGFVDNDEYYICCNCGRVYVPVGHSVPIGPTAKREMFGR